MFGKRLLSLVAAVAMIATLLAGTIGSAAAAPITDASTKTSLYFPWVPNGEQLAGQGPWYGAVAIQNLENVSVEIGFSSTTDTVVVDPHGAVTLSAANLDLATPGDQLVVTAMWNDADLPSGICTAGGNKTETKSGTVTPTRGTANGAEAITLPEGQTFVDVTSVSYGGTTYTKNTDYKVVKVSDSTFNIDWSPAGAEPPSGAAYKVEFTYTVMVATGADCSRAPHVAAAEKQVTPVAANDMTTSGSHIAVDGYTAVSADRLSKTVYLPIVQRNNSWESIIHVSNPTTTATTVTLNLTIASNLASGGNVTRNISLGAGKTAAIDLASLVPTGWIGSAQLSSPAANITALVNRVKPSTKMALINVAEAMGAKTVYAPLIFRNYQDWKTGINLVNISNTANTVTITYYDQNGNEVTTDDVDLPANGMMFVYLPDEAAGGQNFVGAASLSGDSPFLVTFDEVKYTTIEAMSYLSTDSSEVATTGDMLALPVVQKGQPSTGLGDTSGLNVFNPSGNTIRFTVHYYDTAGNEVDTANVTLTAHAGRTLYTLDQSNLPVGFQGTLVITITSGSGSLTAVSNNVNYAVAGDGSSVFSLQHIAPPPVS